LISVHPSLCSEIAYAFGPDGLKPAGQGNLTDYKGTDKVSFTVSDSTKGPATSYQSHRTVDSIKQEINRKVDKGNELVRNEGLRLVGKKSGAQRIDQICSIYDYMVSNWTFVSDWSGLEVFQYSNYTLRKGNEVGSSGKGDCDDFSILLASLIESIGGTPRIIFAYSPTGGHAYTEVYLGKSNSKEAERMLRWLRSSYGANEVNVHVDPGNDDLWLNMDWWKDAGGEKHPGGPFYKATVQIPVYSQENSKAPLTAIENLLPIALFRYDPFQPEVDEVVSFNASQSNDPDGKIVDYEWDFGDGDTSHRSFCQHIYSSVGKFQANLTVTDNEGDKGTKTVKIDVKEPHPEAIGTYSPGEPRVGEDITFDASHSKDKRGQITEYRWDFDDGNTGNKARMKHSYVDSGTYDAKLTVINDRGLQNASILTIIVKQSVPIRGQLTDNSTSSVPSNPPEPVNQLPAFVGTTPHSEKVSGIGSLKKDYYIKNKANDYAKVSVDIKNAIYYEYRYNTYSDEIQCAADLDLVVAHAESITCYGEAKNRDGIPTNITASITNGNITYKNSVLASNQGVQASQNIEAIGDNIGAVCSALGDNNINLMNIIGAEISERFQSIQRVSIGRDTSTYNWIKAITGPLKVSSSIGEGDRKLSTTADVAAGVVYIAQTINPFEASQESSGVTGGATFDTSITNSDKKKIGAYTTVGSGSLNDLSQLAAWNTARYRVEYEYMPVAYQTGIYDMNINSSKIEGI